MSKLVLLHIPMKNKHLQLCEGPGSWVGQLPRQQLMWGGAGIHRVGVDMCIYICIVTCMYVIVCKCAVHDIRTMYNV